MNTLFKVEVIIISEVYLETLKPLIGFIRFAILRKKTNKKKIKWGKKGNVKLYQGKER